MQNMLLCEFVAANMQQFSLRHWYVIHALHNDIFLINIIRYDRLKFSQVYTPRKRNPGYASTDRQTDTHTDTQTHTHTHTHTHRIVCSTRTASVL